MVDVETEEGVTGYMRATAPAIMSILGDVKTVAKGAPVDPAAAWAKLTRRFALIGVQGIARMALAAFDTACWDALARTAKQPLVRFLGDEPRRITAYNSCGLGLIDDLGALAAEDEKLLAIGNFRAVKLRLGHPTLELDIEAVKAVRKRIGGKVKLMVDTTKRSRWMALWRAAAHSIRKIFSGCGSRSATTTMPVPCSLRVN